MSKMKYLKGGWPVGAWGLTRGPKNIRAWTSVQMQSAICTAPELALQRR